MTTRVRITYPFDGAHAPAIEVHAVIPAVGNAPVQLLATLKPGDFTDQYVHLNQQLLLVEKYD